ncbi:hypothetical protein [Mycolicibacterium chlorophenolicum]|uniref:Uncharacterized protein n=1 Tax=Mycolicibacterium chlorophenolicum TaxID=37916 RepID=A0A0J6WL10_9MYCO|nr:hypothetical protein [Mycolicibacterium chlorophenolicum]KMO82397.1 hypothetical protein MCHLDSM_01020 [Mycolicibacterium chlorophenolicum]
MKITVIPTMYRDASNWKVHGEIHLQGELAEADIQAARAALSDGLYYVPGQIGLTHYGSGEYSSYPTEDDHGWQEMCLDEIKVIDADQVSRRLSVAAGPEDGGTAADLVARLTAAARAGWNPALHAA